MFYMANQISFVSTREVIWKRQSVPLFVCSIREGEACNVSETIVDALYDTLSLQERPWSCTEQDKKCLYIKFGLWFCNNEMNYRLSVLFIEEI